MFIDTKIFDLEIGHILNHRFFSVLLSYLE